MASARTLPWYLDSSYRPEWLQRFLTSGGGHVTIWYSMQHHLKDLEGYVLDLKGQTIYYIISPLLCSAEILAPLEIMFHLIFTVPRFIDDQLCGSFATHQCLYGSQKTFLNEHAGKYKGLLGTAAPFTTKTLEHMEGNYH